MLVSVACARNLWAWKDVQLLEKFITKSALNVAFVKNVLMANSLKKMENHIAQKIGKKSLKNVAFANNLLKVIASNLVKNSIIPSV